LIFTIIIHIIITYIIDTNNPQYNEELGYEDSCHIVNTNDPQYNKELEYEDAHQFEVHTFKIFT